MFNATFSNISAISIMTTSFSGWRSRREPPTMDKQLVSFITCGCESSAPFFCNLQSRARTYTVNCLIKYTNVVISIYKHDDQSIIYTNKIEILLLLNIIYTNKIEILLLLNIIYTNKIEILLLLNIIYWNKYKIMLLS